MDKLKKRVVIGLSGGVDSAVAAYLLKKAGYDVVGLFMRNWDSMANNDILGNEAISQSICPQEQDYLDAQKAAQIIGIELKRVDFIKEYWDDVFSNFLSEYQKGRTPNPDILCNKYIKFDQMLNYAFNQLNADFLATGHYAKMIDGKLFQASDLEKDQSYFLAQLSAKQLEKVIFPLADLNKKTVREIAQSINLNVANKKDSTGICFIGERNFEKFLSNYLPAMPGDIIDLETKKVIGKHHGIMYYTIGQRKGLNLGGMEQPYFLAAKNIEQKIIYVAPLAKMDYYLASDALMAIDLNLNCTDFNINNLSAKFRYRQQSVPVKVEFDLANQKAFVKYNSQLAITPGQQVVFYDGNQCIGGATIDQIYQNGNLVDILNFKI